jgi:hypothetical protein
MPIVTIQQTGKGPKICFLVSLLLLVSGVVACVARLNVGADDWFTYGAVGLVLSVVIGFVGTIWSWWSHG